MNIGWLADAWRSVLACRGTRLESLTMAENLIAGEDYYMEKGFMVFTARYHLKRGTCCGSGCRHCPYDQNDRPRSEYSHTNQDLPTREAGRRPDR